MAPVNPSLLQYRTEIRPEVQPDGTTVYMAECPDLPGCMSHGATVEEAQENLEDAKNEYLLAIQERGLPIPEPNQPIVGSVTWTIIGIDVTLEEEADFARELGEFPHGQVENLDPESKREPVTS